MNIQYLIEYRPETFQEQCFDAIRISYFINYFINYFLSHELYLYFIFINIHYQKIDKYKRKYRGNISVGKFLRDFTDGNIPSVYTEGITMGKKIKTKQKKMMTCHFYQRNYRQNHRRNLFRR